MNTFYVIQVQRDNRSDDAFYFADNILYRSFDEAKNVAANRYGLIEWDDNTGWYGIHGVVRITTLTLAA